MLRVVVFLVLLLFALKNQHVVTLHGFSGAHASWPLAWVMAACLIAGAFMGVLAMLPRVLRRKASPTQPSTTTPNPNPSVNELGV